MPYLQSLRVFTWCPDALSSFCRIIAQLSFPVGTVNIAFALGPMGTPAVPGTLGFPGAWPRSVGNVRVPGRAALPGCFLVRLSS